MTTLTLHAFESPRTDLRPSTDLPRSTGGLGKSCRAQRPGKCISICSHVPSTYYYTTTTSDPMDSYDDDDDATMFMTIILR